MKLSKKPQKTSTPYLLSGVIACLISTTITSEAKRIGDPNVTFSNNAISQNSREYPMMEQWVTAGRRTGIPSNSDIDSNEKFNLTPAQNSQIFDRVNDLRNMRGGTLRLRRGQYGTYRQRIRAYNNTVISGIKGSSASRSSQLIFNHRAEKDSSSVCLSTFNATNSGFANFWLTYRARKGAKPEPFAMSSHSQTNLYVSGISIGGSNSRDNFIQNCYVQNAGTNPVVISGKHHTVRDTTVKGTYNKGGGAEGYFAIYGGNNLIAANSVEHIRHFTLQNTTSTHNVVIRNTLRQDISFHTDDGGENLIERNTARLHDNMPDRWRPMLTVWSRQHKDVGARNYVYHNTFMENNGENAFYGEATNIRSGQTSCTASNETTQLRWFFNNVYQPVDRCHKFRSNDPRPIQANDASDTFYPIITAN